MKSETKMLIMMGLSIIFFLTELIVGFITMSMALIADSFHQLSDLVALVVAYMAIRLAAKKGDGKKFTYGYQRAEILGAFTNGIILLSLSFTIVLDSIQRFFDLKIVTNPLIVIVVGALGLSMNVFGVFLFMGGSDDGGHGHSHGHGHGHGGKKGGHDSDDDSDDDSDHSDHDEEHGHGKKKGGHGHGHGHGGPNMNIRGIILHAAGDAIGNLGVIVSGLIIYFATGYWRFYMDGVASILIAGVVVNSAIPLVKESSIVLLQGTPEGINIKKLKKQLLAIEDVVKVNDLHIWRLSEEHTVGACKISVRVPKAINQEAGSLAVDQDILFKLDERRFRAEIQAIFDKNDVHEVTIQLSVHRQQSVRRRVGAGAPGGGNGNGGDFPLGGVSAIQQALIR